jgi:MoxR-like ATPase
MSWDTYYRGDGQAREDIALPPPPPWRTFPRPLRPEVFLPPEGLTDAVNAALCLRRPLLITGVPGSGKSSVIEQVATELNLGRVLRWHITSRSVLTEALYRYDALGRIHAQRIHQGTRSDNIAPFIELGPLGTALLPAPRPRALLIDELDKCDLDLPGDLLDVLERGEFEIAELVREDQHQIELREWKSDQTHTVFGGRVQCSEFPFIVMTSNSEQELPAPFLRRCIRYTMPMPSAEMLRDVVGRWLQTRVPETGPVAELIDKFVDRLGNGEIIAIDQLLNTVHVIHGEGAPQDDKQRERLKEILMRDLSRA